MAPTENITLVDSAEQNNSSGPQNHEDIILGLKTKAEELGLGDSAQKLLAEEIDELESSFQDERSKGIGMSVLEREDIMSEFDEDSRAINVLERDFSKAEGYENFMKLLHSNEVSNKEEEALYDLIINQREFLDMYVEDELDGEMFPDAEFLRDFLSMSGDETHQDEIGEITSFDIAAASSEEIDYMFDKIEDVSTSGISEIDIAKIDKIKVNLEKEKSSRVAINIEEEIVTNTDKEETNTEKEAGNKEKEAGIKEKGETLSSTEKQEREKMKILTDQIPKQIALLSELGLEDISSVLTLFQDLIKIGESGNIELFKEKQSQIQEHLKGNFGIVRSLLKNAKDKSGTALLEAEQFLGSLAEGDTELQNMIAEYKLELGGSMNPSEIRDRQMRAYFGGEGNFDVGAVRIDGDTYNFGDMQVDASSKPPQAFVVGGNDLKLELGLPDLPNDVETRKARREFAQSKIALNEEFQENTEESHDIKGKLQRLQQLENNKENLGTEDAKEYQSLKGQESVLKTRLETLEFDKEKLIVKSAKLSQEFEDYLKTLTFDYQEVHEKQDRARFGMALMSSFGIERVGQDRFNQVIAEIQNGHIIVDLQSPNGFDPQKIDIAGGHFGEVRGDPGGENFRENLAMFVNLMYFGNTEGNNATGEPVGLNVDVYRRASEIENIPGQDPGLASNMDASGILTSTGDLNIDLARVNLKKKVL